ncbi:MAG: hypothetical protein GY798_23670 [Hyphomicrobiales bacterium]|nr:hypothetical protein [Hyphomicrobiales bacterium]
MINGGGFDGRRPEVLPDTKRRRSKDVGEKSNVDVFVEWAKTRLDEMRAGAKALESELDSLKGQVKTDAETTVAKVKEWIAQGDAELKKARVEGEGALEDARARFATVWHDFEATANQWGEAASNQREMFSTRATAQLDSWKGIVDQYVTQAGEMHAQHKASAEAAVARLKAEAGKAEAQLDQLGKAQAASWKALSQGLDESRKSLDKASDEALAAFKKAMRD